MEGPQSRAVPMLKHLSPEDITRHDQPYRDWLDVLKDIRNGVHVLLDDLANVDLVVNGLIDKLEKDPSAEVTREDLQSMAVDFGEVYETSDELLDIVSLGDELE